MAAVLGGKDFQHCGCGQPPLQDTLFIFIQQVPHLVDGHWRILPIQRFLTFALLLKLMLVGENSAGISVVRVVRTVNVAHGR